MSRQPLAVKVAIRDSYTSPTCSVQKALKALNSTVGDGIELTIYWDDIHRDLRSLFVSVPEALVSSVCDATACFLAALQSRLEDDDKFADEFLACRITELRAVLVKPGPARARVGGKTLYLELPVVAPGQWSVTENQINDPEFLAKILDAGEEWDEFSDAPGASKITPSETVGRTAQAQQKVVRLPKEGVVVRPDELFPTLMPMILIVRQASRHVVEIDGSHHATLTLIASYFEKYAAKNNHGRPEVEKHMSNWGNGTMVERVVLKRPNERQTFVKIGLAVVLSFIEGVCGYQPFTAGTEAGVYHYRRDQPL